MILCYVHHTVKMLQVVKVYGIFLTYKILLFFVVRFCHVLDVTGPCRGPGRVGTGPGDVFTRVLTNFHRKRTAVDQVMSQRTFRVNEY